MMVSDDTPHIAATVGLNSNSTLLHLFLSVFIDYSEDSGNLVYALIIATCVLSALLFLAVGYIGYLKRNELCYGNQRNASVL